MTFNASPWNLVATRGYTTANDDPAVMGYIGNIDMRWSQWGGACTYDVTGSMQTTFNESTQVLQVNETAAHAGLTLSGVSFGCFGQISNGQHASFSATFAISAPHPINIF